MGEMSKFGLFLLGIIVLITPGQTNIVASGANHKIQKRCASEAQECCKYTFLSEEFQNCCNEYQCCPICDDVSKGCCYNDKYYEVGTVVVQFPEVCLELICQLIKTEPPVNVIIHSKMTPCKDPCDASSIPRETADIPLPN